MREYVQYHGEEWVAFKQLDFSEKSSFFPIFPERKSTVNKGGSTEKRSPETGNPHSDVHLIYLVGNNHMKEPIYIIQPHSMVSNRKFHPLLSHYFLEVFSVSWVDGVMNSTRAMNSHGSDHVDPANGNYMGLQSKITPNLISMT